MKNVVSTMLPEFSWQWASSACSGSSSASASQSATAIHGLIGDPRPFFMFTARRRADASGSGADDSADRVRAVPAEVLDQ